MLPLGFETPPSSYVQFISICQRTHSFHPLQVLGLGIADFSGFSLSDCFKISKTSESSGWGNCRMQSACNFPMRVEQSAEKPWQLWPLAEFMMFIWCSCFLMFLMLGTTPDFCYHKHVASEPCFQCPSSTQLDTAQGRLIWCVTSLPANSGLSYWTSWKKQFEAVPTQDSEGESKADATELMLPWQQSGFIKKDACVSSLLLLWDQLLCEFIVNPCPSEHLVSPWPSLSIICIQFYICTSKENWQTGARTKVLTLYFTRNRGNYGLGYAIRAGSIHLFDPICAEPGLAKNGHFPLQNVSENNFPDLSPNLGMAPATRCFSWSHAGACRLQSNLPAHAGGWMSFGLVWNVWMVIACHCRPPQT